MGYHYRWVTTSASTLSFPVFHLSRFPSLPMSIFADVPCHGLNSMSQTQSRKKKAQPSQAGQSGTPPTKRVCRAFVLCATKKIRASHARLHWPLRLRALQLRPGSAPTANGRALLPQARSETYSARQDRTSVPSAVPSARPTAPLARQTLCSAGEGGFPASLSTGSSAPRAEFPNDRAGCPTLLLSQTIRLSETHAFRLSKTHASP